MSDRISIKSLKNCYSDKVLYISRDYIKLEELEGSVYIKADLPDDILGKIWKNYDFDKAERRLFELQCKLTKANNNRVKQLQNKIVYSSEAKMLAVRKIAEISKAAAGIDGVVWRKSCDKMRAAILLNNMEYKAKPLKYFIFKDEKSGKERSVGSPTNFDRAMQVLYSYALEPIVEKRADRKSFAFRKGRSAQQAHSFVMDCFTDSEAAEWVLITDVKSYYNSISHKWLLENVPMNKHVLREFLKAGYICNGEFFDTEVGISLGCNISTLLGNFTLDGLQKHLYKLQGEKIQDYKNGYCIRFADDILTSARTKEDAEKFLKEIEKFVNRRGLSLSKDKTRILNIKKEGFEFLSRFYLYQDGTLKCVPSDKAKNNFISEMEQIIFSSKKQYSQMQLIKKVNAKITGFVTYHKCEESKEAFRYLDVMINALLLKYMKQIYPNSTLEQLKKKYWKIDSSGRGIFALTSNQNICVQNMQDTILIKEHKIDTSKNIFLDREYFEELDKKTEIDNVVGKYRKVWDKQEGECYICKNKIGSDEEKTIMYKKNSKDKSIKNIAYIHERCKDSQVQYVKYNDREIKEVNIREVLRDITPKNKRRKESKFLKLSEYFHNLRRNKITLKFSDIERIGNIKLCKSAYKYRTYFTNKQDGSISESWRNQGFKVSQIDMENKKISFEKVKFNRTKVIIPKFLLRNDLPMELVNETKTFFLHLQEKYRIS